MLHASMEILQLSFSTLVANRHHHANTYYVILYVWQGPGGICVKKTGQALVIGIYDEPVTPGQCNMIVERLGDYLIEQGL